MLTLLFLLWSLIRGFSKPSQKTSPTSPSSKCPEEIPACSPTPSPEPICSPQSPEPLEFLSEMSTNTRISTDSRRSRYYYTVYLKKIEKEMRKTLFFRGNYETFHKRKKVINIQRDYVIKFLVEYLNGWNFCRISRIIFFFKVVRLYNHKIKIFRVKYINKNKSDG